MRSPADITAPMRNRAKRFPFLLLALVLCGALPSAPAASPLSSSADFARYATKLRDNALVRIQPPVTTSRSFSFGFSRYPWKIGIVTTVFWVGEQPTQNNPVPNHKSSWDTQWARNFGGYDDPDIRNRRNFLPARFTPRQNPFYIALPYNDVTRGTTKPESRRAIPWFREAFVKEGKSVCKGRWIAVRYRGRICYAQWEDCGPFRTDHWQYVFGNDRPRWNLNQGAGLDVSPAVRDFLGMRGKDVTDWKFVDAKDVPPGPWTKHGDNNTFVLQKRGENLYFADRNNAASARR